MAATKRGQQHKDGPLISRINVERLFGMYTYQLDVTCPPERGHGSLMLLYGSNGSGKTTILNLLYHLLHPEPYGGHRSFVGSRPFKKFEVHLHGGSIVTAYRSGEEGQGKYCVRIQCGQEQLIEWEWVPDKTRGETEDPVYMQYCSFLGDLGLAFHYLRDTRRVEGSNVSQRPAYTRRVTGQSEETMFLHQSIAEAEMFAPDELLPSSIDAVLQWFRQSALAGTNVGYTSVNVIYKDIIKRIVSASKLQGEEMPGGEELAQSLVELKEKTSKFARFGLTPEMDVHEIMNDLKSARPSHLPMLQTVLQPYIDGHAARLKALEEVQGVMSSFVSLLGEFYSHKKATVHLEKGLQVIINTGQELDPNSLSSGEKQLLLLFCNAISSRKDRTVLMIDEPEISLNVKWQRELIPALLKCLSGTAFQLILATHSAELLAQYRDYVTPLENLEETTVDD